MSRFDFLWKWWGTPKRAAPARPATGKATGKATAPKPKPAATPARVTTESPLIAKTALPHINDMDAVPMHQRLLTSPTGLFPLQKGDATVAVLQVGENRCILLVSESDIGSSVVFAIRDRVKSNGWEIQQVYSTTSGVILRLYEADVNRSKRVSFADDESNASSLRTQMESIAATAVKAGATDIHFCAKTTLQQSGAQAGKVLFRIDGIVRQSMDVPGEILINTAAYSYTKMAEEGSQSDPSFNPRTFQSCMIPFSTGEKSYRLRYQSLPVIDGIDVVLRVLRASGDVSEQLSLTQLGYTASHVRLLDLANRQSVGLILVVGSTGSGKSTTLKSLLETHPERKTRKTVSIEDPAEYKIFGVSQITVQRNSSDTGDKKGNPFSEAMRTVMRADPDSIMVGEVRDVEGGELLTSMVQSGHQLYTTVHASSSIAAIMRMCSTQIGIPREAISSRKFLSAVVYQMLVPKLCPHCKVRADTMVDRSKLVMLQTKFGIESDRVYCARETFADKSPCPHCKGFGVKGQTVLAEMYLPDTEMLKSFREGDDLAAELSWRRRRRSRFDEEDSLGKTTYEHGLFLVSSGIISLLDLERIQPMESYEIVGTIESGYADRRRPAVPQLNAVESQSKAA